MLKDLNVRKKITYFMVAVVSVILLVVGVTQYFYQKKEMSESYLELTQSYASEVHSGVVAMLAFDDSFTAQAYIDEFSSGKDIVYVSIVKSAEKEGALLSFVEYGDKGLDVIDFGVENGLSKTDYYFQASQAVENQGAILGYVVIRLSTEALNNNLRELLYLKLLTFFGGISVALVLINYFQRYITGPVEELSKLTRQVRESRDYTLRAVSSSNDELGELAESFNAMMEEVQAKDQQQKDSAWEIMNLNQTLESRVDERTAELQKSMEEANLSQLEAEEASRSKSTFLATMSHEIRTPMNGILGAVELLLMGQLDDGQKPSILTIRSSAKTLLKVIDDILDFSKIEAGKFEVEEVDCCLREVVESVASALYPVAVQKNVFMKVFVDPRIPDYVLADTVRIEQILTNLAGNAIKFSSHNEHADGQVKLFVSMLSINDVSIDVKIEVHDNGIGMSEEGLAKIFKPFVQADQDTTREFGGTGLGLAIATRLVGLMGGELGADSVEGKGSTFTVGLSLPLSDKVFDSKYNGELTGKDFTVLSWDSDHQQYIGRYLEHYKAKVNYLSSIDEAVLLGHQQLNNQVFVIDGSKNSELASRALAVLEEKQREFDVCCRYVFIDSYGASAAHAEIQGDSRVNVSSPLLRSRLINGACIALGIDSPEVQLDFDTLTYQVEELAGGEALGKILFAEDNQTNQFVIGSLLEKLNYKVDIAENGRVALELWRKGGYDLVLTDAHMPEMSGYELTSIIREEEVAKGITSRVPIIFITANALRGEEAKCIKLGADDFIPKPVELKVLRAALSKWVVGKKVQAVDVQAGDCEKAVDNIEAVSVKEGSDKLVELNSGGVDESVLDVKKAISNTFDDDSELYWMTADIVLASLDSVKDKIEKALLINDREAIKMLTHQLKSSIGMLGAYPLSELSGDISKAGSECNDDKFSSQVRQLLNGLLVVAVEIERARIETA